MKLPLSRLLFLAKVGVVWLCLPWVAQAQGTGQWVNTARLEHLISAVLSSHPTTQVQRSLSESAQASVDSARWQYYPTPSVSVERANTSISDPGYQGDHTVSILRLQQPLWTGGRLTSGLDKAEAGALAGQAALEDARLQLALRVLQTYGDWMPAHLKTMANERSLATHMRLRDLVRRRIKEGVSAESDFVLARARLESLQADIAAVRAQRDIALARLGQLLGRPVDGEALSAVLAEPRPVSGSLQSLLDMARTISPAVQKAQAQARVQEATMADKSAELSPEVYVRAERQYGNFAYRNAAPESRVFIGFNTRFGAGLSSWSNIAAARGQYQSALAEVEVQNRAVSDQVLADYAMVSSSEARLTALKAALKAAEDVSESYDRQFLAGRKSWIEVMNAARELAQTEIQVADAQAAQVVASWRLALYTQGLVSVLEGRQ